MKMHALMLASSLLSIGCVEDDPDAGSSSAELQQAAVAPLQAHAHGRSYAEWAAAWQQWFLRAPASSHPVLDETGARCGDGQAGPVWFLAGNFGGTTIRECDVPVGKALFFPLVNAFYTVWDIDPPPNTYAELVPMVTAFADGGTVTAEIDGVPVVDAQAYRVQSTQAAAVMPLDNVTGTTAAECHTEDDGLLHCPLSLANGWYLMLPPLSAGDHTIHFTGALPVFDFSLDVTYHLHVR